MGSSLGFKLVVCASLLAACGGKIGGLGPADAGATPDGTIVSPPSCGPGLGCVEPDDAGGDDVEPTDGGVPFDGAFPCGIEAGEVCSGDVYVESDDGFGTLACENGIWTGVDNVPPGYVEVGCVTSDDSGFFDGGDDEGDDTSFGDDTSIGDDSSIGDDATVGDDSGFGDDATVGDDSGFGDDASTCEPPHGGPTCSPGIVACGTSNCAVSSNSQCCEVQGSPSVCQPASGPDAGTCTGQIIQCDETADCPNAGDVCCLDVETVNSAITSCQPGPKCPSTSQLAYGQICKSDTECASGSCIPYTCLANSVHIEACQGTLNGALASTCNPTP